VSDKVVCGACLDVMKRLPDACVDAIVTDPPYGLEFMGKEWDAPWKHGFSSPGYGDAERLARPSFTSSRNPICRACGKRQRTWKGGPAKCSCPAPKWDRKQADESRAFQAWCEEWAREALRVAKPGAHLVAFGGTRTFHRLACAIEDAGWEIRDCLSWLYGSGFPKSLDVSKAIDKAAGALQHEGKNFRNTAEGVMALRPTIKPSEYVPPKPFTDAAKQWQGWGTALKPAWEPCILARKPLVGTVAANVLAHGTGAINVDACRIESGPSPSVERRKHAAPAMSIGATGWTTPARPPSYNEQRGGEALGRWPANVALDEEAAAMLDEQTGISTSRKGNPRASVAPGVGWGMTATGAEYDDSGGASRFFYTAKASRRERGEGNGHPTVKPVSLMRWLVRLVTPKGGNVLDPFAGSGTTLLAAHLEGFDYLGIEREAEYVEIIRKRLARVEDLR
jgi:site-specific DNA-methyltransferase (adenine-specific)